MSKDIATLAVLMIGFAVVALAAPAYSRAALGMAIGALCWPFVRTAIGILSGEKDGKE